MLKHYAHVTVPIQQVVKLLLDYHIMVQHIGSQSAHVIKCTE